MEIDKIYNEDCLGTLSKMEDNSIDLIVTSPPYNKNFYAPSSGADKSWSALRGRQIPYDVYNDSMPPQEYESWQKKIISECIRVLKPSGSLFYNHKDILVGGGIVSPSYVYDFNVHQQIIWDRGSSPALDPHYFFPVTEYIYWIVKDKKNFFFDKSKSIFRQNIWRMNVDKNPHPAPFPYVMAANIISCCSKEGDIVYDPFMGSGTTALACVRLGRHYIGSEISEKYVSMANEKIRIEESQLKLF